MSFKSNDIIQKIYTFLLLFTLEYIPHIYIHLLHIHCENGTRTLSITLRIFCTIQFISIKHAFVFAYKWNVPIYTNVYICTIFSNATLRNFIQHIRYKAEPTERERKRECERARYIINMKFIKYSVRFSSVYGKLKGFAAVQVFEYPAVPSSLVAAYAKQFSIYIINMRRGCSRSLSLSLCYYIIIERNLLLRSAESNCL